jgi:MFS family permease
MSPRRTDTLIGSMTRSLKTLYPSGGLWRHGDFMKLWIGQSISEFGTPVSQIAIPWIAIKIINASAFEVATLTTVQFLPFLLFTLPAGVWVDRLQRRSVLIVGDVGRALLLATIPVAYAYDALTLGQLYAVSFLVGILTVFFDVAYQSYLPALVERDQLVEGNSKLQVSVSGAQIAGPALGGGLVQLLTAPYAVFADALSFVASGGFTLGIRKRETLPERTPESPKLWAELKEGLGYVVRHPLLRPQAICTGTSNFFGNIGFAILLVYAARHWHMSAGLVGLGLGIGSVGWLVGALAAPRIQRVLGVGKTTLAMTPLFGLPWLLIPLSPTRLALPSLVAAMVLGGFASVVYNITQVSLRQAITPHRIQGRMNAVMRFLVWGTLPLGSLVGGALASTIGLRTTLIVGALGGTLAIVPIALSPIVGLREFPEPEELQPAVLAGAADAPLPTTAHADA